MKRLALVFLAAAAPANDSPQWGGRHSRNMVSSETGLPESFDLESGKNVRWTARLGAETYCTPVVASGRVLIGTNNESPRDPRLADDRGVFLCLDEKDGHLLWELALTKRGPTNYWDWPRSGHCSPATVEGDRVYTVTNRGEVVCLDLNGMANGNDGPFTDEKALFGVAELAATDADVLWLTDLTRDAGVRQHDAAHASILIDGPFLYVNTSNGLNDKHSAVEKPEAPSLVALDKATGRIIAREAEGIGRGTFHCTWSSPSLGEAGGRRLVVFGGGDGVCYAFEALREAPAVAPAALKLAWKCDCDPDAVKGTITAADRNRREGPSTIKSMPVFVGGRVYVTYGGDLWWGKSKAWLKCIDASKSGDLTRSGVLWTYPLHEHALSTPAVKDGLVYVADTGRTLHCVDAATGEAVWTHDVGGEVWASPLVADGRIYLGTRKGKLWVLAEGRTAKVLAEIDLKSPIAATVTAANGTLFVATNTRLIAAAKR
jgi:outer membrane protein assembly factor BamB